MARVVARVAGVQRDPLTDAGTGLGPLPEADGAGASSPDGARDGSVKQMSCSPASPPGTAERIDDGAQDASVATSIAASSNQAVRRWSGRVDIVGRVRHGTAVRGF